MAKGPTFDTITAAFASASKLNANFAAITASFDNTISRDGSAPNTMEADFDMNSNDILNAGNVAATDITIAGLSLEAQIDAAATSAVDAAVSEAAAAISAAAALASEQAAAALTNWTALDDTPASYSSQAAKFVRVKATEDGLEFASSTGTEPSDGDKGDITVSASGLTWLIDALAVDTAELAANAVTTVKITDGNVTFAKIASAAYTGSDVLLVSGTAGTTNFTAKWDANGDLIDGFEVLDEDDMVSDSATKLATQQSIKAFVTAQVSAVADPTDLTVTTSGTNIDITGIAAGANIIDIIFHKVSTDGSGEQHIQIGDAGGFETTGYVSDASDGGGTQSSTNGFIIMRSASSATTNSGVVRLTRHDGEIWVQTGNISKNGVTASGAGSKTLTAELTQIRLTTLTGDTFDNGAISIRVS